MAASSEPSASDLRRRLVLLILFGIVFGYVEAAAVVYIRVVYEPIHQRLFPKTAANDLFPLAVFEQWSREAHPYVKTPFMEMSREVGTLLLLALMAQAVSRTGPQWFASFALVFGVWDLTYYLWLLLLIGWPQTLLEWDLLFVVPVPWVAPVLAPLLVAATMVLTSSIYFWTEAVGRPMQPGRWNYALVLGGGLTIMISFWWDWRNILARGTPNPFNWLVLLLGLAVGVGGFCHALFTNEARSAASAGGVPPTAILS
jgi:hypothetical protein